MHHVIRRDHGRLTTRRRRRPHPKSCIVVFVASFAVALASASASASATTTTTTTMVEEDSSSSSSLARRATGVTYALVPPCPPRASDDFYRRRRRRGRNIDLRGHRRGIGSGGGGGVVRVVGGSSSFSCNRCSADDDDIETMADDAHHRNDDEYYNAVGDAISDGVVFERSVVAEGGSRTTAMTTLMSSLREGYSRRIMADANFRMKSILEVILAIVSQLVAEYGIRGGLDGICKEIDFVVAGVLTAVCGERGRVSERVFCPPCRRRTSSYFSTSSS